MEEQSASRRLKECMGNVSRVTSQIDSRRAAAATRGGRLFKSNSK